MSDRRNAPNGGLGRRREALVWAAHQAERVVASSAGQNRHTRRNNLRAARGGAATLSAHAKIIGETRRASLLPAPLLNMVLSTDGADETERRQLRNARKAMRRALR